MEESSRPERSESVVFGEGVVISTGTLSLPKGVPCKVNLTKDYLEWRPEKGRAKRYLLSDVAAVPRNGTSFKVIALLLPHKKSASPKVHRAREDVTFTCKDEDESKMWVSLLTPLVLPNGARRLLVFVNPFSGKKKGLKRFREVEPLFELAGFELQVIETKKRFHAKEEVGSMNLSGIQGIISVSGDGLVWEIINGLMERPDWSEAIKIPIGVIPAGTGNGLTASLGYYLDPLGAALNFIKGYTQKLDLWRVVQDGKQFWAFLQMAWGIVADVDIESEKFRWMGDARYTMGGVRGIMQFRKYHGTLHYLPADTTETKEDKKEAEESSEDEEKGGDSKEEKEDGKQEVAEEKTQGEIKVNFTGPPTAYLGEVAQGRLPSQWKTVEDEFVYFVASNVTHMTVDMIAAPKAKFADGTMDIVVSRTGVSSMKKTQMLGLFGKMEDGSYADHKAMEYLKAKAIVLEPGKQSNLKKGERHGIVTVDGERVEYSRIMIENMQGLATIFCPQQNVN